MRVATAAYETVSRPVARRGVRCTSRNPHAAAYDRIGLTGQFAPSGAAGYPQLCQERTLVSPSTAMQNDADGHDTDLRPMPEFTIVGADHELPL